MKPTAVADEMFPEGAGTYLDAEEGGGSVGLLMDLSAVNEKAVHEGFFNVVYDLNQIDSREAILKFLNRHRVKCKQKVFICEFEDLFDDEDIS